MALIRRLGRDLLIPLPVLTEADYMIRTRAGSRFARRLLTYVADGGHQVPRLSAGLLRRAVDLDERYADLALGLVDTSVMALAEHHELPVLTFDFGHFRATESEHGPWRLVVSEAVLRKTIELGN